MSIHHHHANSAFLKTIWKVAAHYQLQGYCGLGALGVFCGVFLANKLMGKTLAIAFQYIPLDESFISFTKPITSADHFYHSVILIIFF